MVIREFGAVRFRNYGEVFAAFSERINLLVGDNGQGKTNLAEALYFLCHLTSFRTHKLEPLLAFGQAQAEVQGIVEKDDQRRKARVELSRRGRRAWLDDEAIPTLSGYSTLFYAIVFNPDRLYNYRHYPAERRAVFDRFLSFVERDYLSVLREFRSVHQQKNGLLKRGDLASLADWNQLFAERTSGILKGRAEAVRAVSERLSGLFAELTGRTETLRLVYVPSLTGDVAADLATLERARESERMAGHALYGPHRDDFQLVLGEQRREPHFSQGEYRIALLALKLALNELLRERKGFRPVLILDDLFSELDDQVQSRLTTYLRDIANQVFVTTSHAPAGLHGAGVQIMEIRAGRIV